MAQTIFPVEAEARIEESRCNARVETEQANARREMQLAEESHAIRVESARVKARCDNLLSEARARASAEFAFLEQGGGELSPAGRARHVVEMERARAMHGKGSVIVPMDAGIHVHADQGRNEVE